MIVAAQLQISGNLHPYKLLDEAISRRITQPSPLPSFQTEKQAAFKCGTFGASTYEDRHLATGAFDGSLAVWCVDQRLHPAHSPSLTLPLLFFIFRDLERLAEPVYFAKGHTGVINTIDGCGVCAANSTFPVLAHGSPLLLPRRAQSVWRARNCHWRP